MRFEMFTNITNIREILKQLRKSQFHNIWHCDEPILQLALTEWFMQPTQQIRTTRVYYIKKFSESKME